MSKSNKSQSQSLTLPLLAWYDSPLISPQDWTAYRSWLNKVTYGQNVKDYRGIIQRSQNATTSMVGEKTVYKVTEGDLTCRYRLKSWSSATPDNVVRSRGIHMPGPGPFGPTSDFSVADTRAMIDFVKNVREAQTQMQGGVFLGELREVIGLIKRPLTAYRKWTEAYLREQKRTARRIANRRYRPLPGRPRDRKKEVRDAIADGWLTYAFGARPLANDIEGALEAFSAVTAGFTGSIPVRGKGKMQLSGVLGTVGTNYSGFPNCGAVGTSEQIETYEVMYYGKLRIDCGQFTGPQQRFGLSLQDVIPTAWELIPWSFMIDYFSNVGNVLSAWSLNEGALAWKNRSTKWEGRRFITSPRNLVTLNPATLEYAFDSGSPGHVEWRSTRITRSVHLGGLWPSFRVHFPEKGVVSKLANSIALLVLQGRRNNPYRHSAG